MLIPACRVAGEGEFGVVHKATWYGTIVAAKILKNTSDIALGDFRAEIEVLRKVGASLPHAVRQRGQAETCQQHTVDFRDTGWHAEGVLQVSDLK